MDNHASATLTNGLARSDRPVEFELQIDPQAALADVLANVMAIYSRANILRDRGRQPRLIPTRLHLQLAPAVLTSADRNLLSKGQVLTRYLDGPPFQSADDVRLFCRPETLRQMNASSNMAIDPLELAELAEVIIKARVHCAF